MHFETIQEIICKHFHVQPEKVTRETDFVTDLAADSLDVVELTFNLEEKFDLPETPEEVLKSMKTVGDLADYVERNI